jgi:DNA helicase INO80
MFRDPLRRSVDEEEERRRGLLPQGETYQGLQSPTMQTPGPHHQSPTTAPVHHAYHPHQHHRPPTSPGTTELPPISTALYSRDSAASKYYDPTSDYGDGNVGRDTTRYEQSYHPQVRNSCLDLTSPHQHHHHHHHHHTVDAGIRS